MQLISVNVGREQTITGGKATGKTGIYKQPQDGPVAITRVGVAGDAIVDLQHHGGVDQAVYVYGEPDYAWWAAALGRALPPGTFGENLTVSGLESAGFNAGDILRAGSVTLQVTGPRGPCVTLAARMGDPGFVRRFRAAERPGLYCRVLVEGSVQAGDAVTVERYPGDTVSIVEMVRFEHDRYLEEAAMRRYLASPVAIRSRQEMEARLAARLSAGRQ